MLDMGRRRYSEEERTQMVVLFLEATKEIIDTEGIDQVTIRKVADKVDLNSATLYLYFKDADELITMASMDYLENYCRKIVTELKDADSPLEIYVCTWEMFCRSAFAQPQVYYRLFYSHHNSSLDEMVQRYYQTFPHQLDDISGAVREMLRSGDFRERNLKVVKPLVEEGIVREEDMYLLNDMALCYFRQLLEERCDQERKGDPGDVDDFTQRFMEGLHFLLGRSKNA